MWPQKNNVSIRSVKSDSKSVTPSILFLGSFLLGLQFCQVIEVRCLNKHSKCDLRLSLDILFCYLYQDWIQILVIPQSFLLQQVALLGLRKSATILIRYVDKLNMILGLVPIYATLLAHLKSGQK